MLAVAEPRTATPVTTTATPKNALVKTKVETPVVHSMSRPNVSNRVSPGGMMRHGITPLGGSASFPMRSVAPIHMSHLGGGGLLGGHGGVGFRR